MSSPIPVEPPMMSAVFMLLRILILVLLIASVQWLVPPSSEKSVSKPAHCIILCLTRTLGDQLRRKSFSMK
jgi:hypothetical protein